MHKLHPNPARLLTVLLPPSGAPSCMADDVIATDCTPRAVLTCLLLQTMLNGKERTSQQWHDLMGAAGFAIKSISQAPSMAAIVAVASAAAAAPLGDD